MNIIPPSFDRGPEEDAQPRIKSIKRGRFHAIGIIIVLSLLLVPICYGICERISIEVGTCTALLSCCLLAHLSIYSHRDVVEKNDIKLLDYLVVITAVAGISGITDLQNKITQMQKDNLSESLSLIKSQLPDLEFGAQLEGCAAIDLQGRPNRSSLRPDCTTLRNEIFRKYDAIKSIENELQAEKKSLIWEGPTARVIGMLLIVIGIGLRITKTSAEYFMWHKN